jgi:hypothetical protein
MARGAFHRRTGSHDGLAAVVLVRLLGLLDGGVYYEKREDSKCEARMSAKGFWRVPSAALRRNGHGQLPGRREVQESISHLHPLVQ